jgi:hypothetical protein
MITCRRADKAIASGRPITVAGSPIGEPKFELLITARHGRYIFGRYTWNGESTPTGSISPIR